MNEINVNGRCADEGSRMQIGYDYSTKSCKLNVLMKFDFT